MNLSQYLLFEEFSAPPIFSSFIYLEQDGKILGVQRKNGTFGFPGGKVEPDEISRDAARREFYEETGEKIQNLCATPFRYLVDGKIVHVFCSTTNQKFKESWIGPEGSICKFCTVEEICASYPEFNYLTIFRYGSKNIKKEINFLILAKAFRRREFISDERIELIFDDEFLSTLMNSTTPILETIVEKLTLFNPVEANRLIELIDKGVQTTCCDQDKKIDDFYITLKKYVIHESC